MLVWSRRTGPGLGGGGERAGRNMRKFGVPSGFSIQKLVWEPLKVFDLNMLISIFAAMVIFFHLRIQNGLFSGCHVVCGSQNAY
jgi:hypothetical protein